MSVIQIIRILGKDRKPVRVFYHGRGNQCRKEYFRRRFVVGSGMFEEDICVGAHKRPRTTESLPSFSKSISLG